MIFYGNKKDAVEFVEDINEIYGSNSVSTTIIAVGTSGACFALIVIDTWLEGIVKIAQYYSLRLMNISTENIRDG